MADLASSPTAMKTALEQLGYNDVYHMTTAMHNPKDYDMWTQAFNAKYKGKGEKFTREEWDMLLGDCQVGRLAAGVTTRWPQC